MCRYDELASIYGSSGPVQYKIRKNIIVLFKNAGLSTIMELIIMYVYINLFNVGQIYMNYKK